MTLFRQGKLINGILCIVRTSTSFTGIGSDVDGILSDGFVTLTNSGDEIKSFDIRDGLGMKLVAQAA